ncbi:alpha/beta hydrolase [Paraburkholderia sp. DHOC27]|uniref:alpha/beta hydrolase n=1 Tax=Paraburkholderia sp. DHOC27 TaxID=2303330 RepID=UPI000E3B73E3|nr:alpha/beta hydrolase [Paraburkholderia sp. DHOC27]RFU49627.1 alpha/beta hydrolase [Paraburkholderia sp. DHOC27]
MTLTDTLKGMIGLDPTAHADADMKTVLEAFKGLDPKPIETCSVAEAREQPTPADAVKTLLAQAGHGARLPLEVEAVVTRDIEIDGAVGTNPARVYTPAGEGPFPVILYFHGGGWVIADLDTYDATPRSLAAQSHAIVVSAHYRQAPEHKLPAAHEDAFAAWRWIVEHAARLGGDPLKIAVMGESAGANLAINVSIHARDNGLPPPVHQALIYPVASNNIASVSYEENRNAQPLNKKMMLWFVQNVINDESDLRNPLIDVVSAELANLPPTVIVTAGIDPLRSDGEKLAEKLAAAGVAVEHRNYQGATHEFFGMAPVVQAARDAQAFVSLAQRQAFGGAPLEEMDS